jgi:uncharacterized Fe-S cluster protein YjdI
VFKGCFTIGGVSIVTVTFDPNVCKHSGVCIRSLPAVFDVKLKRWVQPDNAPAADVIAAVRKCPSGALQIVEVLSDDQDTVLP